MSGKKQQKEKSIQDQFRPEKETVDVGESIKKSGKKYKDDFFDKEKHAYDEKKKQSIVVPADWRKFVINAQKVIAYKGEELSENELIKVFGPEINAITEEDKARAQKRKETIAYFLEEV